MSRSRVFVRPARQSEAAQFLEWSSQTPEFDPAPASYPSTITWAAYTKGKVISYMPIQTPFVLEESLMLESVGVNPDATLLEKATALAQLTENAITQAHSRGIGEIYFLGSDDATEHFAKHRVFEELPYKIYRLRIRDTEQ